MDTGKVLLLGGAGVAAWWFYENYMTPATAAATAAAPSAPSAPVQPATAPAPGGGTQSTPSTLAGLWAAIQQWAAADSNFTGTGMSRTGTPFHWSYYLSYVWPNAPAGYSGTWPPDLGTVFPGVDLNQPMTASTFWGGMGAYLGGKGLSGLFGLFGLGQTDALLSGQDFADSLSTPLPACGSAAAGFVGPVNCDPSIAGGESYPASQSQIAALAQAIQGGTVTSPTNYAPWLLGGAALVGVMLLTGGRR